MIGRPSLPRVRRQVLRLARSGEALIRGEAVLLFSWDEIADIARGSALTRRAGRVNGSLAGRAQQAAPAASLIRWGGSASLRLPGKA